MKKLWIIALATLAAGCGNKAAESEKVTSYTCPTPYETVEVAQPAKGKTPKNIIFMIGDGMGLEQVSTAWTANRGKLNMEKMPYVGLQRSYCLTWLVTDSAAAGTALAARLMGKDYLTYVVTGDGELGEGSCWEGFMTINHYNLSNCIVFIDRNHNMIDGNTEDVKKLEPLADKMTAFGFNTIVVDGNNIGELCNAIDVAIERSKEKCAPTCILMDTKKGAGIKSIEGDYTWHYGAIDDAKFEQFNKELEEDYKARCARAEKEGK